jgi:hypothetical protein
MRADAEFRTALELDPDNRLAQKSLSTGANATGHLKNPFRRLVTPH